MEKTDETLSLLTDQLKSLISEQPTEKLDIGKLGEIADIIHNRAIENEVAATLGQELFKDFRDNLLSRAKAIELLSGRRGQLGYVIDSIEQSGYDFERLIKLRNQVNSEFNKAFSTTETPSRMSSDLKKTDYVEFKC
ncbi:MAG: hypothetical protein GY855_11020 [candidate division Zixibacteria bacterium]|nr:hypothetical protein [candidate division Zixibacteria bacterium]